MKAIRLIVAESRSTGNVGLILKGTPDFEELAVDTGEGLLIAHDILEHQNGLAAMGPVWDELEAIGGIWYCRGQWGDLMSLYGRANSVIVNVSADITRMFSEWLNDQDCGPGGLATGSRPHDLDEDFAALVEQARRDIPREYNDMGRGDPGEDENGWNADLHEAFETYLTLALHRIRNGFRKAARRFQRGGASQWYGHSMMQAVRDAVAECVKHSEMIEGAEYILTYGNGEAACRPVNDWSEF